ncbi:hypothetical protein E2C01_085098 [Portunus trituberculatus]|uniref:Uncharacterized protein n=1 Tax=Portunus trituberculatus TaxID=210409 RepID=A0A5B7J9J0_PORTR|nr:hypothetical protein [Portunus trituberculatus]
MSAVTRFKQSVSHGKERKTNQPSPASAWATPCSVFTCTAYVCLVTPSALGVGLPLRPWNVSCFNAHASTLNIGTTLPAHHPGHLNTRTAHPPGGLRRPPLLVTCCPSPYLCQLEDDRPATTPVITTQDYPRAHKDPKEATNIYGSL